MRIVIIAFILCSTSVLTACTMTGNVVPKAGPSMEQVYDSMPDRRYFSMQSPENKNLHELAYLKEEAQPAKVNKPALPHRQFRKLSNPELTMYVFPHLAGKEALPIPGYSTVFNAYTNDHYALPNEMIRG